MMVPSVHDSFILSVYNQLEDQTLTIISHYRDEEIPEPYLRSEFRGVVAHHFQHVHAPSILFDIEETDVGYILSKHHALFEEGLKYSWPYHGLETISEIQQRLRAESINGYQIEASCGLGGFVLASSYSLQAFSRLVS